MMSLIPYGKHFIDKSDKMALLKVLNHPKITEGKHVSNFENQVKKILNVKYAVAVSSCSAGLHLAVKSLNLKKNSKIITSPITFVATANSAKHNLHDIDFSDINNFTLNMDVKILKKKIINQKKIKIIMPVHLGGYAADSKEIYNFCKKKGVKVIEDAAHSFGAKYSDGSMVGSCKYSDMTIFSFHPVKTITTGEGGLVTTNSKTIYKKLLRLRTHGIIRTKNHFRYQIEDLSFNYRITDIQCALGISQLKKLKKILNKRKKIANFYDLHFKKNKMIDIPQYKMRNYSSNHLYILKINFEEMKIDKNLFIKKLFNKGIITQVHYIPIPYFKLYSHKKNQMKKMLNAKKYYDQAISIPIFYDLSLKKQKFIINSVNNMINEFKKN